MELLLNSVIDYVRKERTSYALMINGEWGSGKTYFWDNFIREKLELIRVGDLYIKTIYVSLYGVTSVEEISKKIFYEVYASKNEKLKGLFDSKVGNAIPEIGKMLLSVGKMVGFDPLGDSGTIDWDKLYSLKNKVLCFDDLERANIEVSEILGYINNFVEHDNVKTIIICNEKEVASKMLNVNHELKLIATTYLLDLEGKLLKSNNESKPKTNRDKEKKETTNKDLIEELMPPLFDRSNDYKHIKEKLVGKTLTYKPDYQSIISKIIEQNKNYDSYDYLKSNIEFVLEIFNKSMTRNMRILQQTFDDFEKVYNATIKKFKEISEEIIDSMLLFTLIFSFEMKSGKIGFNELLKINSDMELQQTIIMDNMDLNGKSASFISYLMIAYNSTYKQKNFIFFKFIKDLVKDGIFNRIEFENELSEIIESRVQKDTPSYMKIIKNGYWDLTDIEFNEALEDTFNCVKAGEIPLLMYFRGFDTFTKLYERGLIQENEEQLFTIFSKGLEIAVSKAKCISDTSYYFKDIDLTHKPKLKLIMERIIEINQILVTDTESSEVNELLSLLTLKIQEFREKIDRNFYNKPVFFYCDVTQISNIILKMDNKDINYFRFILLERYQYRNNELEKDKEKLLQIGYLLKADIDEYLKANKMTLHYSNIDLLITSIQEIIESLSKKEVDDKSETILIE
ncbi:MAG: P-loop NTPase fold protein [Paenibacillaceae bacterium]